VPKKPKQGKEDEKKGVRAKHRRMQKIRVQPGRPNTHLMTTNDVSSFPYPLARRRRKEGRKERTCHVAMTSLSHSTSATHFRRSAARHLGKVLA